MVLLIQSNFKVRKITSRLFLRIVLLFILCSTLHVISYIAIDNEIRMMFVFGWTLAMVFIAFILIFPLLKSLEELSSTDGLTGIANRRIFEEHLEKEWLFARRTQQPLSLIFLDIDYFKEFNDVYGHQAGDQCLRKVAHSIKHLLNRPRDMVARYGGEEFVIILPETCSHGAVDIAERLRKRVEALEISCSPNQVGQVTASLGVACLTPTATMSKENLIQLADQAVYEAKSGGRNRVVIHFSTN